MFVIFDLLIFESSHPLSLGSYEHACILASSHPHIIMFVCTCLYPRIITSSYFQVHMPLLTSLHPHILRFMCACLYPCIFTSSYPQVYMCQLVSSHPCILISSGSFVLACILRSSHPHILRFMCGCLILASSHPHILRFMRACWYPHILISSYPQVFVCQLVCSHLQVNLFSIRMNNCILASSSSLVLRNCASQFVKNLQILRTGQAFVLDFYHTRRKIYRKQSVRADLKKT